LKFRSTNKFIIIVFCTKSKKKKDQTEKIEFDPFLAKIAVKF
jgi:hypothetical protein